MKSVLMKFNEETKLRSVINREDEHNIRKKSNDFRNLHCRRSYT